MVDLRFPVPDAWRLEYPHYIANRGALRFFYFWVLLASVSTFLGYGYYSYYLNLDTKSEISSIDKGGDWTCSSLNEYSGFNDFYEQSGIQIQNRFMSNRTNMSLFIDKSFNPIACVYPIQNIIRKYWILRSDLMWSNTLNYIN